MYIKYVRNQYGKCNIVFDGYESNEGSTKDQEHQRRIGWNKTSADIVVKTGNIAHGSQEAFLTNTKNKTQFVSLLTKHLQEEGNMGVICEEDADTQIAKVALELAVRNQNVTVVCDDTDVIVLLIHHFNPSTMCNIFFQSEAAKKVWNIRKIVSKIGITIQTH